MNIVLEPKSNGDDAKFAINKEELATIKHKLENLRYSNSINGVYIRIAICAYENEGKDLLEGKLTFSGDTYFAILEMLTS